MCWLLVVVCSRFVVACFCWWWCLGAVLDLLLIAWWLWWLFFTGFCGVWVLVGLDFRVFVGWVCLVLFGFLLWFGNGLIWCLVVLLLLWVSRLGSALIGCWCLRTGGLIW